MKMLINKKFNVMRRFLQGGADDNRRPVERVAEEPSMEMAARGQGDAKDDADVKASPLPVAAEVTASVALDTPAPVHAAVSPPTVQLPGDLPAPSEPIAGSHAENDGWLHAQLNTITRQFDLLGNRLQKIEEALGAAADRRGLLEEQEQHIQGLTTRLREAEEKQITQAIMGPVVRGLIQLFDTVWKAQQDWKKQRPANADEWCINCLATVEAEIIAMLNRHNGERIQVTTNVLQPDKQRVVRTEFLSQVQDGAVCALVRPGFYHDGRVVRPEEVVVAKVEQ